MGARALLLALAVVAGVVLAPPPAAATTSVEDVPNHWSRGEPRFFVSSAIDLGFVYGRPRISLGYGLPHYQWVGLDLNPIFDSEGIGAWAGLRFDGGWIDLKLGTRYFYAFRRSFVARQERYDKDELEDRSGPQSQYLALEAELTAEPEVGPGTIVAELAGTRLLMNIATPDADRTWNMYEETIKVIAKPPWIYRARVGWLHHLGDDPPLKIGAVVEVVSVPARDAVFLRAGLIARLRLFSDLELRGHIVPKLLGPDSLGLAGGNSFQIGIRWRWATGDHGHDPERDDHRHEHPP